MRSPFAHVGVEVSEVLGHVRVADRSTGSEKAGVFHRPSELHRIGVEDHRFDQPTNVVDIRWQKLLDQPEVQEGHPPVRPEQVVARVGITVEEAEPVEGSEHEPEDRLAREVALFLGPLLQLGEPNSLRQLRGEHAPGAELGQHARHVDEGMIGVEVGEALLAFGFQSVVELLA